MLKIKNYVYFFWWSEKPVLYIHLPVFIVVYFIILLLLIIIIINTYDLQITMIVHTRCRQR